MSAEKPKAPEQPTPPRPPKPEVTRDNLTAENLTYFTPESDDDEKAALEIENAPFKVVNKRRRSHDELLNMRINYGPDPDPNTAPAPNPEKTKSEKRRERTRSELAKLSLDELHKEIQPYIPPEEEWVESGYDETISNKSLRSSIGFNIRALERDLRYKGSLAEKYGRNNNSDSVSENDSPEAIPSKDTASNEEFRQQLLTHLDTLLAENEHVDKIVKTLWPDEVANNLDKFLAAGVKIDIDKLVKDSAIGDISNNPIKFIEAGASIDVVLDRLNGRSLIKNYNALLEAGARKESLDEKLSLFQLPPKERELWKTMQTPEEDTAAPDEPTDTAESIIEEAGPFNPIHGEEPLETAKKIIDARNTYNERQAKKSAEKVSDGDLSLAEKVARAAMAQVMKKQ